MPTTDVTALLAELDPLPYPERMRLLARRAKENAAAGTLRGLLDALWSGDADHRALALTLGVVARDEASILAGLRDGDPRIASRALRATRANPVDTAAPSDMLSDAPADLRARLYRMARRTPSLAEALVGPVRVRFGDHEAARVLTGCSPETVERLLPELGESVGNWTALARRHPGPVLDEARRRLDTLPEPLRDAWWTRHGTGVLAAAGALPEQVIALLEAHPGLPGVEELDVALGRIAATDPARVVRLLTDTRQTPARWNWRRGSVLRRIATVDTAALAALARSFPREDVLVELLGALPPSRREALFDAATADRAGDHEALSTQLLATLPHVRRIAEARRCLALPRIAADEDDVLRYTAFLPFPEVRPVLTAATRRHLAEDRAVAYTLLVECAARSGDPEALGVVLGGLDRLTNEQDPVRAPVLEALAAVPPGRYRPSDADALTKLTLDAVEARDAAWRTRTAIGRLAARILGEHSDDRELRGWAIESFERLFGDKVPDLGRLDHVLRRGQERDFLDAVLPWLEAGVKRARFEPLFAVASALGKRAHGLDELQELLRKACDRGNIVPVIGRGIELWLDDRSSRAIRVEEIVRGDTSTVTLPVVWNILCADRTDLLDLVLSEAPAGRHIAEGARWVPNLVSHLDRWLPRQREAYSRLLAKVAGDAGAQQYARTGAIRAAAEIPGLGWAAVDKYVESPDVALAEAALGALASTDRPGDALEVLLDHVDGDRARVAAFAAGRAARFTPPSRLGPLLAGVLTDGRKVTSRKEAARLLSRLSVPGAMDTLAGVWRPTLHRDIRAAVVTAVRSHLDDPRAWQILDDAVDDAEQAVALAVIAVESLDVPPRHRSRYGGLVVAACDHPQVTVAAAAWTAYPSWAAWAPDAGDRLAAAVADLDERVHWRSAARAVAELAVALPDTDAVAKAVTALLDAEGESEGPDRDRPAAQRLDELTRTLVNRVSVRRHGTDRTALVGAGGLLSTRPDHVGVAARLLIASVGISSADTEAIGGALGPVADLLAGRPVTASQAAQEVEVGAAAQGPDSGRAMWSAAGLLASRGDLAAGLFALALVTGGARYRGGWTAIDPPWREMLLRLRQHPEAEVRSAALDVVIVAE